MADDSFFGGLQSGLQDLLPNKITYATPEQIKAIRGTGEEMYRAPSHGGVYTWGNAFGDVAQKIMGGYLMGRAGELEKSGLEKGAEAVTTPSPASDASSSDGDASASTRPGPTASANPGAAATGEPPTSAADISARLETGSTDYTKSMANISPDTNGSKSYGSFGLNSQPGYSAHDFKKSYGEHLGLTAEPGTPEFDAQWAASVKNNPIAHRAAEVDWHNKNIVSGLPSKLERVGVGASVASDPRVTAYFADRVVQQGPGSITNGSHAARIQAAYGASGDDPVKFLKAMSLADRTPEALQADFPKALKSGVYSQQANDNRVMGREALSLALPATTGGGRSAAPGTPGVPGAPGALSPAAIAPMVNALAGPGGAATPAASAPGASISANPNAPGSFETPVSTNMMGTLKGIGAPPTGGLASDQQAIMAAMRGGPAAGAVPPGAPPVAAPATPPMAPTGGAPSAGPGAPGPAAMTQAIAGSQAPAGGGGAAGRKPDIPASMPMSALPRDDQIQTLLKSNIPQYVEQGKELAEYKRKMLTPQQFTAPDGTIYIGTPFTPMKDTGMRSQPQLIKSPFKIPGAYEGDQISMLGTGPGGGPALVPVPTVQPPGGATPAAGGGAPGAGGLPPMPNTSDVAAMANWGTQVSAQRKAAEATAEETAKGAVKPMTEAMDRASKTPDMIRQLDIMSNAYKQSPSITGGVLGPAFHDMRSAAAQLGLISPNDTTLTAQNIIDKIGTKLSFDAVREFSSRPAAQEVALQLKAMPGLKLNAKSSLYIIDLMRQSAIQDQEIGKIAMTPGITPSRFAEARDQYYRDHPMISPFTGRPVNEPGSGIPGLPSSAELMRRQSKASPDATSQAGPPPAAAAALKANPTMRDQFDAKYGAGSAAAVLGR